MLSTIPTLVKCFTSHIEEYANYIIDDEDEDVRLFIILFPASSHSRKSILDRFLAKGLECRSTREHRSSRGRIDDEGESRIEILIPANMRNKRKELIEISDLLAREIDIHSACES